MKLNDNGGFRPFRSDADVPKETRDLDENVNEGKSHGQQRGRADHDDPSVILPGNSSI